MNIWKDSSPPGYKNVSHEWAKNRNWFTIWIIKLVERVFRLFLSSLKLGFSRCGAVGGFGVAVAPSALGQAPAVHEDVDGMDEHQQSEESQSDVHLKHITAVCYLSPTSLTAAALWFYSNQVKKTKPLKGSRPSQDQDQEGVRPFSEPLLYSVPALRIIMWLDIIIPQLKRKDHLLSN